MIFYCHIFQILSIIDRQSHLYFYSLYFNTILELLIKKVIISEEGYYKKVDEIKKNAIEKNPNLDITNF